MMRLSLLLGLLFVPAFALSDEVEPVGKKTAAREIKSEKLPTQRGAFGDPVKLATAEDLAKAVEDKDAREAIAKQVDLKGEYLLLFRWAGSGQDKVEMAEKDGEVTFTYVRGRTRDLRNHAKLFALPAKATYKVAK